MKVTAKQVFKYMALPGIGPRIKDLFHTGFSHVSFFMAQIYGAVRLLPAGHPYLNPVHIGEFGIRHVVAEAASRLSFKKENIDQVMIFGLLALSVILIVLQIMMTIAAFFIEAAHAQTFPTTPVGFFEIDDPTHDVAFMMLDRVMGIPEVFNSCVAQNVPCVNDPEASGPFPWPMHRALHSLLQVYSVGLLVIGAMLFLYFVSAVVMETAQSGTAFGKRFSHVWAPLRMVTAVGLLIPVANGLNAAQYIVLYAAKYGSNFATNGWNLFSEAAQTNDVVESGDSGDTVQARGTPMGSSDQLVATPKTPDPHTILETLFLANVCTATETGRPRPDNPPVLPYIVRSTNDAPPHKRQLVGQQQAADGTVEHILFTDYDEALDFAHYGDIVIVFGQYEENAAGEPRYHDKAGFVKPTCGSVVLKTSDIVEPGPKLIQEYYYFLILSLWSRNGFYEQGEPYHLRYTMNQGNTAPPTPDAQYFQGLKDDWKRIIHEEIILPGRAEQLRTMTWIEDLRRLGWGCAACWYNKIAQLNGGFIEAVFGSFPIVVSYPAAMEHIRNEKSKLNQNDTSFTLTTADGGRITFPDPYDGRAVTAMLKAKEDWDALKTPSSGAFLRKLIMWVFGLDGLYSFRDNDGVHPLAQLSALGKSVMDASIRNLFISLGGSAFGTVMSLFEQTKALTGFIDVAAGFFGAIAMSTIVVGFILYYLIPFLPFLYFFFAVMGWVKGIIEAMVGVPLWALAHIRIDGDGLPGQAASTGYFLILEIFLRPIMTVFGLIGSITIFAAQVTVLNSMWDTVVENVGGFDRDAAQENGFIEFLRGPVDQFFYLIIYVIVVYLLAMSSFKLIDMIPNQILRWMGQNLKTFGEESGDPAENLVRNVALGGSQIGGQAKGAIDSGMSGIRSGAHAVKERMGK